MALSIFNTRSNLNDNPLWCWLGKAIYYICWPLIWAVIAISPKRTRVLLVCKGHLLLTKDWIGSGKWAIPGGGLHIGEEPTVGALREFKEETGIDLLAKQLRLLGDIAVQTKLTSVNLVVFRVELDTKPRVLRTGLEILDHVWIDRHNIDSLRVDKATRQVLDAFLSDLNLLH